MSLLIEQKNAMTFMLHMLNGTVSEADNLFSDNLQAVVIDEEERKPKRSESFTNKESFLKYQEERAKQIDCLSKVKIKFDHSARKCLSFDYEIDYLSNNENDCSAVHVTGNQKLHFNSPEANKPPCDEQIQISLPIQLLRRGPVSIKYENDNVILRLEEHGKRFPTTLPCTFFSEATNIMLKNICVTSRLENRETIRKTKTNTPPRDLSLPKKITGLCLKLIFSVLQGNEDEYRDIISDDFLGISDRHFCHIIHSSSNCHGKNDFMQEAKRAAEMIKKINELDFTFNVDVEHNNIALEYNWSMFIDEREPLKGNEFGNGKAFMHFKNENDHIQFTKYEENSLFSRSLPRCLIM